MTVAPVPERTYSYWSRFKSAGILGLGMGGTGLLFGGLVLALIVTQFAGLIIGGLVFLPTVLICWLLVRQDRHGRHALQRSAERLGYADGNRRALTLYRSGPAGMVPSGTNQLPGLAARSDVFDGYDSYGRRFAIIHHPVPGHVVVVFSCDPEGGTFVDQTLRDAWVGGLDAFLFGLGQEPDIVAAQIIVETSPDSGAKVRRNITVNLDQDAPQLAKDVLGELAVTAPSSGASVVNGFVTITLTQTGSYGHTKSVHDMIVDLSARIPGWVGQLSVTGAGVVRPVTVQELSEELLTAFDPNMGQYIERAYAEGTTPELSWNDVGPVAHDAEWDHYRHDRSVSMTWQMTGAPTGLVTSNIFERFLTAHPDIPRKRVAFLYRPIKEADKNTVAAGDVRTGGFLSGSFTGQVDASAAIARAQLVAAGKGLVNFGLLVTGTTATADQLPVLEAAMDGLAGGARIRLRVATGMQDTGFAAALPLGLVLPLHLKTPARPKKKDRR